MLIFKNFKIESFQFFNKKIIIFEPKISFRMEIKGTSVKSTKDFVQKFYADHYDEWINSLPSESQKIFSDTILATEWYPIMEGMIIPVRKIAKLFYNGDEEKAAFEVGKYSAETSLTGVYKVFVKISSPIFVLKRSQKIFSTYYKGSTFEIVDYTENTAHFRISGFKKEYAQIFDRIEGWMEGALIILNRKLVNIGHNYKEIANNYVICQLDVEWE